jgi:6-phosphogluconolactonase
MTCGLTRREFLAGAAALPQALRAMAEPAEATRWMLLGTDKGKGIYRASWSAATGAMGPVELVADSERPVYFAMHPKKPVLYVANELNAGDGKVSSFRVDGKTGGLAAMQQVSSAGAGPCYVSVDETGQTLFVADYGGGAVAPISLKKDGELTAPGGGLDCRKNEACGVTGPVKDRQDAAHLHCAVVAPDNKYLLVCNLGEDAIEVIPIKPGLASNEVFGEPERVAARSGSGPRHVAFHPNKRWVYCIHELDCTIDVFAFDKGKLAALGGSTVSTLGSEAARPGSTGCEIVVSKDGRFVYANTRGENSLAVYRVNAKTGMLTEQQRVQTGGDVTRLIAFDPTRRWLLCMNQGSDSVTVFAHDEKTGKLGDGTAAAKPKTFRAESPMCVSFV